MARIGFIGLGVMGAPMAGHLVKAGHEVRAFNRTNARAQAWAALHGGAIAATIADAADGADIVVSCVSADADLQAVFAAAAPRMKTGAVFIDHSTVSARLARDLAGEAAARGFAFLDAPVSGGQAGAEAGRLAVFVGGDAESLAAARPVLDAYAAGVTHVGPSGSGQLAKMVNQICIAGVVQGLAEAIAFAQRAGLDAETVFPALSKGAAQSWQMDNRWRTMSEGKFEFGFAVDLMRKDLGLVLEEARAVGASAPVAALVDQFYAEVQAMGGSRWDTSSLVARLNRL